MEINDFLVAKAEAVNKALDDYLPAEDKKPAKLHQSMRYSTLMGGKRLRPVLTLIVANSLFGVEEERIMPAAAAVELVHNYSLIHDDLPCMDDDDYRRGELANHKVFGDAIAVLSGDALLTYAFELLTKLEGDFTAEQILKVSKEVAQGAGFRGMVGGQAADMLAEGKAVEDIDLEFIHRYKTGALLQAAVRTGAILGGADKEELAALTIYAENIGLSFQIIDDILDIVGDEEKLGKEVGSDEGQDKATFPSVYGLEESRAMAQKKVQAAKEAIERFEEDAELLIQLADYIIERDY
ncbi:polyprenyl synthetase family protein [Acetohalobium arabaticum]|uniref:Farnesyl diphosphate synthase n=1 Tax=Acetohalobium arabaticum (strain ATCC 49924 / DSM 5501 / Z-7288) TaxID=574087 RepID=D9QRU8_ACEAZ|nr:farnesyl diphosphate synthase [Acetohalobium arabaticum]ADL13239.1 farnesyl-diphosphate synthase [Acetohalobium arabaticum DSM 5501]